MLGGGERLRAEVCARPTDRKQFIPGSCFLKANCLQAYAETHPQTLLPGYD